jgi:hypothetical protein
MGFLRKAFKKVKKGIKKVARGIKKVVKKISKSKILKTIALVGAALVTGGAAVGAFGGTLKASQIGQALLKAKNFITGLPVVGTVAKPFEFIGTALGTGAGKVTDFLGFTSEAGRLGTAKYTPEQAQTMLSNLTDDDLVRMKEYQPELYLDLTKSAGVEATVAPQTTGFFGTTAGQFVRDVGMSYVESKLQPEPEYPGEFIGYGSAPSPILDPLQVSFAQPAVNLNDAYSNLQFGTGDVGYLASDLYRQETVGGMA